MAVARSALKRQHSQQCTKSAFGIPPKSSAFSRIQPPVLHTICHMTGGLSALYKRIQNPDIEYNRDKESSDFTDENGSFAPTEQVPLLAKRYRFVRVLGKGCSATLLQAIDTFRPGNHHVAIKVLNQEYYELGYQESNNIERLNQADPNDFSGTVRLLNTFSFGGHFCLVFELLHPKPLHHYFKRIPPGPKKLRLIRKVALRLLQVLGFLRQENVIHADLKPENVLCQSGDLSAGVKVIDFGNAIHCVYDELSLYYDDFELQTLLYRAPEVVFGLPFGPEIDMWSLGCILAELYLGTPLFYAITKEELLQKMTAVLGPLPVQVYQRGKFFAEYEGFVGKPQTMLETQGKLFRRLGDLPDYNFGSFILSILRYNPNERISVSDAFLHPFLAPEVAARFLLPPTSKVGTSLYEKISIPVGTYTISPVISPEVASDHLTSLDLLRRGTASSLSVPAPAKRPKRAVAEVAPFAPKQDVGASDIPAVVKVPVNAMAPTDDEVPVAAFKQEAQNLPSDYLEVYSEARVAHSTVSTIPEMSLPKADSTPKLILDRAKDGNTFLPNSLKHPSKQRLHALFRYRDLLSYRRSGEAAFAAGHRDGVADQDRTGCDKKEGLSADCLSGTVDPDMNADTVAEAGSRKAKRIASVKESGTRTWQHDRDSDNSVKGATRRTDSGVQSPPSCKPTSCSKEAPKHPATSPTFNTPPSETKEIFIGTLNEHIENTIEEEYVPLEGYPQGPPMSRFKHLEKMKKDTVRSDKSLELRGHCREWHHKSDTDGLSKLYTQSHKTLPETSDPASTASPDGSLRQTPPFTPSNSQEDFSDGLNLLTPLSSRTTEPSSIASVKDTKNLRSRSLREVSSETQDDIVTPTRRKIQATSEVEEAMKASLLPNSGRKSNMPAGAKRHPVTSVERQAVKRTTLMGNSELSLSGIQNENPSRPVEDFDKARARHSQVSRNKRRLGTNEDSRDVGFKHGLDSCDSAGGIDLRQMEGSQNHEQVSCRETRKDEQVGEDTSLKESDLTPKSRSAKQRTEVMVTPRFSVRKSKTKARERLKMRSSQGPCRWWELSHEGRQGEGDTHHDGEEAAGRGKTSTSQGLQRGSVHGALGLAREDEARSRDVAKTTHKSSAASLIGTNQDAMRLDWPGCPSPTPGKSCSENEDEEVYLL